MNQNDTIQPQTTRLASAGEPVVDVSLQQDVAGLGDLSEEGRAALVEAIKAQHEGQLFAAETAYKKLMRREPHAAVALMQGVLKLLVGEFEAAWPLFERRLETDYYAAKPFHEFPAPVWDGAPLEAGRLLIVADQGIGDTILLARYLPWVLTRVESLAFQVNPGTEPFWRRHFPNAEISRLNDPFPDAARKLNMFSLPRLAAGHAQEIPRPGYVAADPDEVAYWRDRLGPGTPGTCRVGISWQGNPKHVRDFERSIPLEKLVPLLQRSDVVPYSLQLTHGDDALNRLPVGVGLTDLGAEIRERPDPLGASAALIDVLDLVICVDSALANLAGAMDKPFWLPTYKVPDWRWRTYRGANFASPAPSPWYGSQRLFPCASRGAWEDVIGAMMAALDERPEGEERMP